MCRQSVLRRRAVGPAVSLVRPTLHGVVFAILCPEPAARPALARRRVSRLRSGGRAGEPHQHAGAGMVGIALDAGFQFCRHRRDDALSHSGGARVGLDVEADAVVGDRQPDVVTLRLELDVDGTCAVGAGVDAIVTGDQDLLTMKSFENIPIIDAAEALKRLGLS